jgi:hypothetical protein
MPPNWMDASTLASRELPRDAPTHATNHRQAVRSLRAVHHSAIVPMRPHAPLRPEQPRRLRRVECRTRRFGAADAVLEVRQAGLHGANCRGDATARLQEPLKSDDGRGLHVRFGPIRTRHPPSPSRAPNRGELTAAQHIYAEVYGPSADAAHLPSTRRELRCRDFSFHWIHAATLCRVATSAKYHGAAGLL